eukprot:363880-Chlamydomonas_euryale.AAC.6
MAAMMPSAREHRSTQAHIMQSHVLHIEQQSMQPQAAIHATTGSNPCNHRQQSVQPQAAAAAHARSHTPRHA